GTGNLTRGFMSLGLLFRTKAITDARVFYCPSAAKAGQDRTYEWYSQTNGWPWSPDDQVRTYYNYYPQSRELVPGAGAAAGMLIGKLTYTLAKLEVSDNPSIKMIVMKAPEVDLSKSISTDLIHNINATS